LISFFFISSLLATFILNHTLKLEVMNWIWALVIGAVAGWLAGAIMDSSRGGILFNIVLGILGGIVGSWLFGLLHIFPADNIWGVLLTATVGAVVIIVIARLITGGKV
jgi:uncharacterized membrane protein YeaQ/YmgE (transglycosylase-associated protein family)